MKATFFQRFIAYIIDIILISMVVSLITIGFSSSKADKLQKDITNLTTSYTAGDITLNKYIKEYQDKSYDLEMATLPSGIVYLLVIIVYFVVFQFLNKGQTIGKKLIKIRIVTDDGKNPSIKSMIIRNIIPNEIILNVLSLVLLFILNKEYYFYSYEALIILTELFVFVCAIMIVYRKDKKGLHDIMAKTSVVNERG